MDSAIAEYQKWKQQGEALRVQAKQAMELRFREMLLEAAQIAQEYQRDFGLNLKPPPTITAFRFKSSTNSKTTKTTSDKAPSKPRETHAERGTPPSVSPKVLGLRKTRAVVQKKIAAAKDAGKPTRNLEDKLYVIDDELRLAGNVE